MPDGQQWLQNHRETDLWDGPDATADWRGKLPQWSIVRQDAPQQGERIRVHYFGSRTLDEGDAWLTVDDVGPVDEPANLPPEDPGWASPPGAGGRWLMNFQETELWEGPTGETNKVGPLPQWSIFAQLARQTGPRIPVYYYGTRGLRARVGWVSADHLGPIHEPPQLPPAEPDLSPAEPGLLGTPRIIQSPSQNHGGGRMRTVGCVMHSTRGNSSTVEGEFRATLNWFGNPGSQVSAHIVIAADGTIAEVVDPSNVAWHAGFHNDSYLGIELVQPRLGDMITDAQYRSAAWWLKRMSERFGFVLNEGNLPEHRQTAQGVQVGKTDIGQPYSVARLKAFLDQG